MAHTDDIPREVADLLFKQLLQALTGASDVIPAAYKSVTTGTSDRIRQMIDEIEHNKELKHMLGMEGEISNAEMSELLRKFGERSSSVLVGDRDAKDYESILKDMGLLYAKMDRQDDDCTMFVYMSKDQSKIENATHILKAQRGQITELNPKLYFNSLSPEQVHVVEGLTPVEMELFRHYAREQGLLFTAISRGGEDMLVCSAEDAQKARRALLYTGWALTGANGAKIREQVEHRLAGRTAINIAAEEGAREMVVVSQRNPGHHVRITSEDYELYKNNKKVSTVPRTDPDFYTKCVSACEGLSRPVVMSAEQYREGFTPEELQEAHTIELFPTFHEDMVEMDRINSLANLVAKKSGMDNEHNATWGLWDTSVSYSEFSSYEFFTDQEEQEARAMEFEHFKQAAYYSHDHHTAYSVDMKEKNLDYLITRAEEKRRQQTGEQTPQHEQGRSNWLFGNPNKKSKEEQSR